MGILFNGIIQVTGEPDTGKTVFAMSCGASPDKIFFVDDDIKGSELARDMLTNKTPFGGYVNLVREREGMKEVEYHQLGMGIIDRLTEARPEVLIWDTWGGYERTFYPYVVAHPDRFRNTWSPKGDIRGAELWHTSFDYEATFLNKLQEIVPLVILISHLKEHTVGPVRTGKSVPDDKRTLAKVCTLRLWLRHNQDGPEPVGLVLKRISKRVVTASGIEFISVLPRRIKPCTWEKIRWYWDNPIANRTPTEDEMPTEYELSILNNTLTTDQLEVLRLGIRVGEQEDAPAPTDSLPSGYVGEVVEMRGKGMTVAQIAAEMGSSPANVARALAEGDNK